MDTVTNGQRGTPTGRRADAREFLVAARALVREAARKVDGDYETIRHNCTTVLVTIEDALDAVQAAVEADLREWADLHCERADELAAEWRGDC